MSIGILYESVEWSNLHLCELLNRAGVESELINLETEPISLERIFEHKLVVNRLFPSAPLRGYQRAFQAAGEVLKEVENHQIPMINSYQAYAYDCSKMRAGEALAKAGIPALRCYANFYAADELSSINPRYPCVLKPDCGGRSLFTYILHNQKEFEEIFKKIPRMPFVIQNYIKPVKDYITRIEIVGENIMSIMKRYVGADAISSYHAGSVFKEYVNCPDRIIRTSFKALRTLDIEMGSLDVIESDADEFFIIDVNATTNFSADNVKMLGFDPIQVIAEYIIKQYKETVKPST